MAKKLPTIPDQKPFQIGLFEFTATGLLVNGKPSFEEYQAVGDFIQRAHKASGWWLADWLRYGDSRSDWRDRLEQAIDSTGLAEKTLKNVRAVGAIPPSRRRDGVEFAHHAEVTGLSGDEQQHWLERAEVEGWTRQELRQEIRASKRRKVIEGQAVLAGKYRVIYADPPWRYADSGATGDGSLGKAERHYSTMTIEQLAALPVAAHAHEDAVLFLWVTVPLLLQNPGPREVIEGWGFTYKSAVTWDKVHGMPGHYGFQVVTEHLLICTRGSCLPDAPTPHDKTIQTYRRTGEHSEKPEEFRRLIMKHWTEGPYLELFGRQKRAGWTVFGDDAALWGG